MLLPISFDLDEAEAASQVLAEMRGEQQERVLLIQTMIKAIISYMGLNRIIG